MSLSLFIYRQVHQIKAGGFSILCRKAKRFMCLFFLNVAAPVAVYFKMDWPQAYDFLIDRYMRRRSKLQVNAGSYKSQINKLEEKTIVYLEKRTDQIPDLSGFKEWMYRRRMLGDLYWFKSGTKQSLPAHQRTAEVQSQIVKKYQLDVLDITFIPRAISQGSVGGNEHLETYIKAGILGLRPNNKKMVLLSETNVPVTNPCFLKYWSKYITVISDPQAIEILAPLEGCLTLPMVDYQHLEGKLCMNPFAIGIVRDKWIKANHPPILVLSSEDHERGWSALRAFGLPQDAWFVTLHVREAGSKDRGSNQDDFRNADITTYFSAIKAVTDAGGWVIRIGDPAMTKLPAMPQVVDYAHSQSKSDWMDIFLCSQCRFMISSNTGMCVVALSFGVPLVMTNMLPGHEVYYYTNKDLFLPRLCYSKDKERYSSFYEFMSPPLGTATSLNHYDDLDIQIKANTAEEIRDVVKEMLGRFNGDLQYSEKDESLQEKFRTLTAERGKFYTGNGLDVMMHARVGRNFLQKHSSLLPGG